MHQRTPYSTWGLPGTTMFAPSPKLVELQGECLQETETPPLRPMVDCPDTKPAPDMTVLTESSGKYQGPPPPIPTTATVPTLPSQSQPITGQNHQHYGPHCLPPGPPTCPIPTSDPMVKMLLQKIQDQQQPMYLMMLIQATRTTTPPPHRDHIHQYGLTKVGQTPTPP